MEGHEWTPALALEANHSTASVLRGIAPPRQSGPFDVRAVLALPAEALPHILGAPVLVLRAIVFALFWVLREIELAHVRDCDVRLDHAK